jgi:ATP-dependent protease ClpP protease subunit
MTKTWYNIKALNSSAAVLTIFAEIGSFGVTAAQFVQDLTNLGSITDLTVKINSPGGSVSDGVAIFNALKASPAQVQVEIDGWALSIASFIAMAGDKITMANNSLLMIHNPWATAAGNAADLRKMADVLDKTRDTLLSGYGRSGKSEADLIALLDAETWFDAEEALAAGFIDEIITVATPIAAGFDSNKFNVPSRYLSKGNTVSATTTPAPTDAVRAHILAQDTARRNEIASTFKSFANHEGVAALQATCQNDVNCSVLDANAKLLAHLGGGASPVAGRYIPDGAAGINNRSADFQEACVQSLLIRAGVRVTDPSPMVRDVERMNITAMAENILSMNGKRASGMGRADVIKAAMSTSDFPQLLANTAGKALMLGYENEPTTHAIWTAEKEVANFKPQTFAALSEAPGLLEVPEGGEYKRGAFGEGAETFSIKTFGRVLEITRQALINDDLEAFTQMPAAFGSSARRKEADLVYAKLTGNTVLSDNNALFHAEHGNLAAAGAALSVESLGAARSAMRRQKGRAGEGHIDPQPRFLIVPVTLESKAESILSSLVLAGAMNDTSNLQWIRNLTLVADPRLDDVSETAWYLAASPTQLDTIVRAYLAGQARPFYEEELEFMRDTMGIKSRLDFGCGVIDYRGLYKNPGA